MIGWLIVMGLAVVIWGILWVGVLAHEATEAQYQSWRYRPRRVRRIDGSES